MATQKSEWEDLAQAALVGVWGYLVKPISASTMALELESVMSEWAEAAASADNEPGRNET